MIPAAAPDRLLLLLDLGAPATGARNMALDEALIELGRSGAAVLRLYAWDPPCLSLGRNQRTPARPGGRPRREWRPGREIVRRPTGGRSVYHGPELTYAFACPDRMWGGPREVYRRVNRAIGRGLAALGVALDAAPRGAAAGASVAGRDVARPAADRPAAPESPLSAPSAALGPDACFRDPAPGELTVGGRKLVGSAQWRHRRAILQHGSILIRNEQARGVLDQAGDSAAVALADLLSAVPDRERLAGAVAGGFGEEVGSAPAGTGWPDRILAAAGALERKYGGAEWTWRR